LDLQLRTNGFVEKNDLYMHLRFNDLRSVLSQQRTVTQSSPPDINSDEKYNSNNVIIIIVTIIIFVVFVVVRYMLSQLAMMCRWTNAKLQFLSRDK